MGYEEIFGHSADFEVRYRFFTKEEGGRSTGTPYPGYRCDWLYDNDDPKKDGIYGIHPEFIEDGQESPLEQNVPIEGIARMWIRNLTMRKYHQGRIKKGTKGYFVEGPKKVAEAKVIRILALNSNPTSIDGQ